MHKLIRNWPECRLLVVSAIRKQYLAIESSSSSAKTPSDKTIEERYRTKEPTLTPGEVTSRVQLAPQYYHTSMEDNFERTTVNRIGDEMRETKRNYIAMYSETGFTLHDQTMLIGPIALFPKTVLSWRVKSVEDITPESMLLFTILEPKLDIVVVGAGDKKQIRSIKERLQPLFREHSILLEVLDTPDACATFNFLNNEGRYVAAALFPAFEVKDIKDTYRAYYSWNNEKKGWFGMSDTESTGLLDHTKKRLEAYAQSRKEREGDAESDLDKYARSHGLEVGDQDVDGEKKRDKKP